MSEIRSCPACYSTYLIKKGFKGDKQNWLCNRCGRKTIYPLLLDSKIVTENVRLAKQKQSLQDRNVAERKSFREHARIENAIIEYHKALIRSLDEYNKSSITKSHKSTKYTSK